MDHFQASGFDNFYPFGLAFVETTLQLNEITVLKNGFYLFDCVISSSPLPSILKFSDSILYISFIWSVLAIITSVATVQFGPNGHTNSFSAGQYFFNSVNITEGSTVQFRPSYHYGTGANPILTATHLYVSASSIIDVSQFVSIK